MDWPKLTDSAEIRLRVILLAIAVLASVLLPYKMLQSTVQGTRDNAAWVTHSAEIKGSTFELMYVLRDMESILLALYTGTSRDNAREIYASGRERSVALLDQLDGLTVDNPEQLKRIGELRAIVEGRTRLFDQAMQQLDDRNYDGAGESVKQARALFAFRQPAQVILDREQQLFTERSRLAAAGERNARWTMLGAFGAQLVLLAAVIFISERQVQRRLVAETRAQQAIARSRAIVQNVREPIVLLDTSLRLLMSNGAFREVYGLDGDEHTGARLDALGDGAWSDPVLLQRLSDVLARDRELWDYELSQRGGGIEREVLLNARRMALPSSDEPAILMTIADITVRKRSEQRIQELNRDLEAKVEQVSEINRELEAFSYSVSHDLRAPLRHISGFADKLGIHLGAGADEKAHHYLEVISASAVRMSALIEDLLLYSRLGRHALRLQPIDMQALVEEIRAMLVNETAGRSIQWRIGGLPVIVADEGMMRQVWQNLLGNAVKYTARREQARIEIGIEASRGDEVVFFVKDNGAGFDMEYAGKLFGVFQRLHKSTDFPGTGIGLANVRRIVGRHGGRTWAEAVADKGATFYFSLPASLAHGSQPESIQ